MPEDRLLVDLRSALSERRALIMLPASSIHTSK